MHSIAYTRSKPVTSHNRSDRWPACHPKTHEHRKGAILVIVAALIVMLATIGSMTIGIAQIQLVRAELRMATDAAAKAAVTTLGRTQSLSSAFPSRSRMPTSSSGRLSGRPTERSVSP